MKIKKPKIALLIVAAGRGERMGCNKPKQYIPIHGKTILKHTIEKFLDFIDLHHIQCVIAENQNTLYETSISPYNLRPAVIGGLTRQESVRYGLEALKDISPDYVLIHDAARPCINQKDIHNIIHKLIQNDAANTICTKVHDTILQHNENIDRDSLIQVQTPQSFPYEIIMQCHNKALEDGFTGTDDTSILVHYGHDISYIEGGKENIKITKTEDLGMAEKLLENKFEVKIGQGFDVHAFKNEPSDSIRLCGIDIPFHKPLDGHSDADIGLHVITDAILGALAEHDIGYHFPSSDNNIENMDSHVFLTKALHFLEKNKGRITHLDITFVCEEPNIGKYRDQMRTHIGSFMNLSTSRISVKGTTTQTLGFLGRKEAIAAQCIATIEVPYEN
jgi:2-C-methyl-D-erythritol 4-phosphate cytidylyltransferase/2-C-methyl-D-erythritol 2,4-cyclodiphosphate synthase